MRSMNMPSYGSQQPQQPNTAAARQTPRLQNTQKPGLGNGTQWGFGLPNSSAGGAAPGGFAGAAAAGAALGAAPGMGPRPTQLSGFAQVMGGGGSQAPIDMSDFPTLSGGPQPASNAGQSNWNSNILRQQPAQQQQQPQPIQQRAPQQAQAPQPPQQQSHQQQQQQQQQQRVPSATLSQQSVDQQEDQRVQQASSEQSNGGGDEFPPLGVRTNGEAFEQNNGLGGVTLRSPDDSQTQGNGQQTQLPFRETSNTSTQAQQAPIGHPLTQTTSQQQQPQSILAAPVQPAAPSGGVKRYADMSEQEQWGLEALSAAYEARKNLESGQPVDETLPPIMRSAIFFGQDLSALGMDLDSLDPIYPTFTPFPAANSTGSTFDFHDRHTIPDFQLPGAYTVNNVPPLAGRVAALSDETLFCIFYQMPHDIMQELAAQELTARDWRWHKLLRQWLQKDTREANNSSSMPIIDLTSGAPIAVQPVRVSERVERGVYVFFDVMNWRRERREFVLNYDELDQRFAMGNAIQVSNGGPVMPPGGGALGSVPSGAVSQSGMGSSGIPGAG